MRESKLKQLQDTHWWMLPLTGCVVALILLLIAPYAFQAKPKYLATDYLLFLLIGALSFGITYIRRTEHLRQAWSRVFQSKVAMGCFVVLLIYVVVALLDSMHYQRKLVVANSDTTKTTVKYVPKVESVLDIILQPLLLRSEKSYSAPFARNLYIKENIEVAPGKIKRDYPKLQYGATHLKPGQRRLTDVATKSLMALIIGIAVWGFLFAILVFVVTRFHWTDARQLTKRIWRGETKHPWHIAALCALVIITVFTVLYYLSFYYHVFGTNQVGKDTLYEAIKSFRTGIMIGTLTTLVMLPFAVFLGIAAGYFKGWIDDVIQFIYTVLNSIPSVLLIAACMLIINVSLDHNSNFNLTAERADLKLLALCAILGITSWTSLCRLLRGESLKIREIDYIQAAHAFGVYHGKVMTRHILPNVMHIVMIVVVIDFSGLVLAEAVLSYIGIGVDPIINSWGNMINSARLEMAREPMVWWSLAAAFVFMFALVLSANLFSDAVRDAFDPRLRKN